MPQARPATKPALTQPPSPVPGSPYQSPGPERRLRCWECRVPITPISPDPPPGETPPHSSPPRRLKRDGGQRPWTGYSRNQRPGGDGALRPEAFAIEERSKREVMEAALWCETDVFDVRQLAGDPTDDGGVGIEGMLLYVAAGGAKRGGQAVVGTLRRRRQAAQFARAWHSGSQTGGGSGLRPQAQAAREIQSRKVTGARTDSVKNHR